MTIQSRVFDRLAVCSARVTANNYFSVSKTDIESTDMEPGDQIRVRLSRTDKAGPTDSDIYETSLQKSNQLYIPKDTREKLDLEAGDTIKYIAIPKKSFPGLSDGPVRDKLRGDDTPPEEERPEREANSDTFSSSSMQKTGQLTVPADTMDTLGLLEGDDVSLIVSWEDRKINATKRIGTGKRITLSKEERQELGIEPGDEPEVLVLPTD